jgi:hypothetical protein
MRGITTTIDLIKYSKKLKMEEPFICNKDKLRYAPADANNIIINLADFPNGSHWTCFRVIKDSVGKLIFYFDSFGVIYPKAVMAYAKKHGVRRIYYNRHAYQNIRSGYCGSYCLLFLKLCEVSPDPYKEFASRMKNHQIAPRQGLRA